MSKSIPTIHTPGLVTYRPRLQSGVEGGPQPLSILDMVRMNYPEQSEEQAVETAETLLALWQAFGYKSLIVPATASASSGSTIH